jgi:hypothetical protein
VGFSLIRRFRGRLYAHGAPPPTPDRRPFARKAAVLAGSLIVTAICGCDGRSAFEFLNGEARALRIATDWPQSDRDSLARDFAAWLREQPPGAATPSSAIAWASRADRAEPPDVYLGGPLSVFADLAARDELERLGVDPEKPAWTTARRAFVGLSGSTTGPAPRTALADPRVDPMTLAWTLGRLRGEGWAAAYPRLLVRYGLAEAVGWREGSPSAAVQRGEADVSLTRLPERSQAESEVVVFEEGAAIRRGTRRGAAARAFLEFLEERAGKNHEPTGGAAGPHSLAAEGLAADLLGATLVDAQDELRAAVASVREAGLSPESVAVLSQAPPWPPASVGKLLTRGGEGPAALVETLTHQLAPEAGARVWLSQSWLRPRKPIDGALLEEIAGADQGRLARGPRFRAWLRAEWTQWARQRYRWVARLAAARSPLLTSSGSGEP